MIITKDLEEYIEGKVFPKYNKNEEGHGIKHIKYVINRCFELSKNYEINMDILYTIAAYHDIGHHIDAKNHEVISANIMYEDNYLSNFFSNDERLLIKEAIEDHRASLDREPRSIYGKLVSSADRNTSVEDSLRRTYFYRKEHNKDLIEEEVIEDSYNHLVKKFGVNGYANFFVQDKKYEEYLNSLRSLLNDKEEFIKAYKSMISLVRKERAKQFAIEAHRGQVRKNEPEKPMIIHPIAVGNLLEYYGYDNNVIAAGYLHDVVEDTKYTIENIKDMFGKDISDLVMGASEPDKSMSWEERKQHTINEIRLLPLRNKLIVCADKINNLEDLLIKFKKTGERDFSLFKRGQDEQKWYYTSIYESIIHEENENEPIFVRLKDVLDRVFENKKDTFLIDTIFKDNRDRYNELEKLHAKKTEVKILLDLCELEKPFVIEFCGTPRTGKTTIINNLQDFFKKGGFKAKIVEELTTSKYYKECVFPEIKGNSSYKLHARIISEANDQLHEAVNSNNDIVFIDRSLNDRAIWNYRRFVLGDISKDQYNELLEKYSAISKELIDILVVGYTDSLTSLRRDYINSLALENRKFLNIKHLEEYNNALNASYDVFNKSVKKVIKVDTTNVLPSESSIIIANDILSLIKEKCILELNNKYN